MKTSIPIAVTTGTFYPVSTLESIRRLKELGIRDVELTLQQSEFSLTFERKLSTPILPGVSALVESGELHVRSVHAPHMSTERSGYSLQARLQLLIHSIEVCRVLGGGLVVVHPFHLFRLHEQALEYLAGDCTLLSSALLPGLQDALDLAHFANIRLALENIQDWHDEIFFNAPGNMSRLLRDMEHPSLGVTLDLIHAQIAGTLEGFFDSLAGDILNVHASDLLPPAGRVPVGNGGLDWDRLVPRLHSLPHLHQISVELSNPQPAELTDSLRILSGSQPA
jgi:sugar phosphate isomerase/epimerase